MTLASRFCAAAGARTLLAAALIGVGVLLSIPPAPVAAVGDRAPLVAVVDTGITPVPALRDALDLAKARSFVPGEDLADTDGHGTQMTSVIHASAPQTRILALKALDAYGGTRDDALAEAITYAVGAGARIINLSVAGAQPLPKARRAILKAHDAGVLVVVAAGNNSADLEKYPTYPASYRLPNVAVVTATDASGRNAAYANTGTGAGTVRVPAQTFTVCTNEGLPTTVRGTSAAAAVVTARAAALAEELPHATPAQLLARLAESPPTPPTRPCASGDEPPDRSAR